MVYIFAGSQQIAEKTAYDNGFYPKDARNVKIVTPKTVHKFRGIIVYDHDQIIWGDFPNGGSHVLVQALTTAKR